MRKFFALSLVALMALTFAIAAVGCGQKQEETPAASETTQSNTSTTDTSAMAKPESAAAMTGAATDTAAKK